METSHIGGSDEMRYQVMPDRMTILENEMKMMRHGQKLQNFLFIAIFCAMMVAGTGIVVWQRMDALEAIRERKEEAAKLQKNIDDLQAKWLSKLEENTSALTSRYDRLSDRLNEYEKDLSWIKGRQDAIREWLPAADNAK